MNFQVLLSQVAAADIKRLSTSERHRYERALDALLTDPTTANPWVVAAPWDGFPSPKDLRIMVYGDVRVSFRVRTDPGYESVVHLFTIDIRPDLANGG